MVVPPGGAAAPPVPASLSPARPHVQFAAIVGSNLLTLLCAWIFEWGLLQVLWPYWIQSVVIGVYAYQRIQARSVIDTAEIRINGRPIEDPDEARRWLATFFALHYGLFHLVYLIFLGVYTLFALFAPVFGREAATVFSGLGHVHPFDPLFVLALGASFAYGQHLAYRAERSDPRHGPVRAGTLMMLPYLRILPMHVLIIGGMLFGASAVTVFVVLKTVADLLTARFEQHHLSKPVATPP